MESIQLNIGFTIAALRDSLHMDQSELASKVGLSRASISNIENGRQTLTVPTFVKIADAMRIPPDALLRRSLVELGNSRVITLTSDDIDDPKIRNQIAHSINQSAKARIL